MAVLRDRVERVLSQLGYHSRLWAQARQAEDYSTMVEELGLVDSWLDELLKARPELAWDRLPWNVRSVLERGINERIPG